MKTSDEIRTAFLNFFQKSNHLIVPSSSLIPNNDPTLLFTNAGMVQFKDVFLGKEIFPEKRAASSQCCVRAGGKHNDLENVGYTARHHTFFEMLGNFSFGDYFKREAIRFAWEFLTTILKLPPEKLWVTVYEEDDEAADIWLKEMKVDPHRFSRCGAKDNFWSMGDTGPCGPCSEIFYDHGEGIPGGPPGSADADGDRYIEIWNLVFMQFNRAQDGTMTPLPKPSVDTGMGLERIAAVVQGVHSNYEIDIFQSLIKSIAHLANLKDLENMSLRVIADHIRSSSFLIADGITPSNEGRGYVLRRIIRRAIRHGYKLGFNEPFLYKLVTSLIKIMGNAYPHLKQSQTRIEKTLKQEEEQFANTLDQGTKIFQQSISNLQSKIIPGEIVFRLYDTYGFPPDLTNDMAREIGLELDYVGFEKEMEKQRQLSQEKNKFSIDYNQHVPFKGETEFTGYEKFTDQGKVVALVSENKLIDSLPVKSHGAVILDKTPFYAESGGQIGDKGILLTDDALFRVHDTQKQGLLIIHYGQVEKGSLHVNDKVTAEVDSIRKATMLNHSATHLLHAALRRILGDEVIQKGSLVEPSRLRFDFSYSSALTSEQIKAIENLVNQQIQANIESTIEIMTPKEAQQKGALALFGEKYGESVRVMSIGEFSMELCGGTHVKRTGDIGLFKILSESGIAAGIRRIEAVTGEKALLHIEQVDTLLQSALLLLKADSENFIEKLNQCLEKNRELEKEIEKFKQKGASVELENLLKEVVQFKHIHIVVKQTNNIEVKLLRHMVDQLKSKLHHGVILLANVEGENIQLVAGVTKDLMEKISAGDLVGYVAKEIDGKGGGRSDMAQGGGKNLAKLPDALQLVTHWIQQKLS